MKNKLRIHAQHGWGFDSSCWGVWRQSLPRGWQFEAPDRGYFENVEIRNHPSPFKTSDGDGLVDVSVEADNCFDVVVAHSLGLFLVPSKVLARAKLLVVISGFEHFHLDTSHSARRVIRRMLARLSNDPFGVLNDFWVACGNHLGPSFSVNQETSNCNLELLMADLKLLDTAVLSFETVSFADPVLVLHGQNDKIVPQQHAYNLHQKLSGSRLILHPDAGHDLPFSHYQWCITTMLKFLDETRVTVSLGAATC